MSDFATVHKEAREGFDIELAFAPETMRKIDNGTLLWFVARVRAIRAGVTLGTDYLGGCCYKSAADFMEEGGYYSDMVNAAIEEARATLAKLGVPA